MKNKIKYLSDCELRIMFVFWSVDSPASRLVLENELKRLGWDSGVIEDNLASLIQKGMISRHWLGHGNTQKEFYMPSISEQDYWANIGCGKKEAEPRRRAPVFRRPCTILWI